MKYNFDAVYDRTGSDSIKYEKQLKYGVQSGLLPFWIADTDFATLPEAVDALKERAEHPLFGYTYTGERTLKTVQAWYSRRHQVELPLSAFMPSQGVVTAIWFSLRAFTNPGDKVLTFTPVYDPFFAVIKNQDRQLVDCPLDFKEGYYCINWERLEKELQNGVKAMIFCNPHNPVGRVWGKEEVEKIVALCKKYSVLLLSDEIHSDVVLYGNHYTSVARFWQMYDNMIVYTAISKTFNMAGLHSSCILLPNPEMRKIQEKKMREAWIMGPNAMANRVIEACYTYGDAWVDEMNEYLTGNAELVMNYLHEHAPLIEPVKPEGTYLMWLDCRKLNMTSDELSDRLVKDYKMAVGSGAGYGDNAEGFLRLNIGCPRVVLQKGLEKLAQLENSIRG